MNPMKSDFEQDSLKLLANKYPLFSNKNWSFTFWSESGEFSCGEWGGESDIFNKIVRTEFYVEFILLLNDLIVRRCFGQDNAAKDGVVIFGNGNVKLYWN